MALDLKGKTALVTGGGSDVCLEFTKKLLARGCNMLIADLKILPEAQEIIDSGKSFEARAKFVKIDVTDWRRLQYAFEAVIESFGRLDIVCPDAGVFGPVSPRQSLTVSALRTTTEDMQALVQFLVSRHGCGYSRDFILQNTRHQYHASGPCKSTKHRLLSAAKAG